MPETDRCSGNRLVCTWCPPKFGLRAIFALVGAAGLLVPLGSAAETAPDKNTCLFYENFDTSDLVRPDETPIRPPSGGFFVNSTSLMGCVFDYWPVTTRWRVRNSPFRKELENAMVSYVRALNTAHQNSACLSLWTALERLVPAGHGEAAENQGAKVRLFSHQTQSRKYGKVNTS